MFQLNNLIIPIYIPKNNSTVDGTVIIIIYDPASSYMYI